MLAVDPDRFWRDAEHRAAQIDDWPMIRLLCERATQAADPIALPWLVRSWSAMSSTVTDPDRPEGLAIQSITGQHPRLTVDKMVFEPDADLRPATRLSAWCVMARMTPANDIRHRVAQADESDPLLGAMRRALPAVDQIPYQVESVYRLLTLDSTTSVEQWQQWAHWRERYRKQMVVRRTELRHLPAITRMPPQWFEQDQMWWQERLLTQLDKQRHADRGDGAGEFEITFKTRRSESLDTAKTRMSYADVLTLAMLIEALQDRALVESLFEQADADLSDTTTEHGGVLTWSWENRLIAQPFAPLMRQHDQAYYASDACVTAMHTGLAHYHFHAQKHDNAVWAGPGQGDLTFADRMNANCVVFTFIDANTLNADAYFPRGVIVDLGCIRRRP